MPSSLESEFLLDPGVVFLNHGSFGACPRSVFEAYQRWQAELEREPVDFIGRRGAGLLHDARARLASYLNASPDELVFFTNPTTAANMVARSLIPCSGQAAASGPHLLPGDEILTTDQEYPAMDRLWEYVSYKTGARLIHQPIPLPVRSEEEVVKALWAGISPRTKLIFLSHVTCSTGLIFPVDLICKRARSEAILTIVDGAHAPGHVPLDLQEVDADIYVGACHKWLCAPKGSAFLYARPEVQRWLEPLVISRGWGPEGVDGLSPLVAYQEMQGTRDLAAFLSVPEAIGFQERHAWHLVRERCHELARRTRARLNALTGLEPLCPDSSRWFGQMVTVRIPEVDVARLGHKLWEEYRIEVPVMRWQGQPIIRISYQAYNDEGDADALFSALERLLRDGELSRSQGRPGDLAD